MIIQDVQRSEENCQCRWILLLRIPYDMHEDPNLQKLTSCTIMGFVGRLFYNGNLSSVNMIKCSQCNIANFLGRHLLISSGIHDNTG